MIEPLALLAAKIWDTLLDMAPYLLFGFFVAGMLSLFIGAEFVRRHLGTGRFFPAVKAALFGVPLPLCSCSVIPVAALLRRHGATRGATSSFLLSAPQTGADSILVTYSLLGPVFAIFRPLVAFLSGLIGGLIIGGREGRERDTSSPAAPDTCCAHSSEKRSFRRAMYHGFVVLPREIANPLFVGLLLAGLIAASVPHELLAGETGSGLGAKLVMMVVGIPLYVCATATVPVAAALIHVGVSPGAALVFLMTGPATNAATVTTVWKLMGRGTALLYLGVVAVSALAAGVCLDYVYAMSGAVPVPASQWMLPESVRLVAALLLLAVLVMARYGDFRPFAREPAAAHETAVGVEGR